MEARRRRTAVTSSQKKRNRAGFYSCIEIAAIGPACPTAASGFLPASRGPLRSAAASAAGSPGKPDRKYIMNIRIFSTNYHFSIKNIHYFTQNTAYLHKIGLDYLKKSGTMNTINPVAAPGRMYDYGFAGRRLFVKNP
ncbi:MAG: hypothetical protein II437_06660 [Oscillospiraceae bacterium]|nr:hypothetical protein [Oscillospiraceae bacterium]